MDITTIVEKEIRAHPASPPECRIVIGVSGGADSVALLHVFHALNIPCTVAHMNHQLRGTKSDADEQFVRELADELGFTMVGKKVDVRKLADDTGQSVEMAARQARHEFFAEFDNAVIALAHHADDQVETFILKLARGAGTDGLCGMPYRQEVGRISLIRPMLNIPRKAILSWLTENGLSWREDASNTNEAFLRNRVRHTILPLLERELNPNIRKTILRTMDILREENGWMESVMADCHLPIADLPLAAKRRVLRKWLFDNGAEEAGFDTVESILRLMDKGNGTSTFELSDRQRVVVEYGQPRFEDDAAPAIAPSWNLTIEMGHGWIKDHGKGAGILPAEASFDADKVEGFPLEVRTFQPGDRMEPLGMEGSRKLQDILTDQKIPKTRRSRIPVVVCRGTIIWLPGYRIARDWAVRGEQGKSVHVRIEQNHAD